MKSKEKAPKTTVNSFYWILLMVPVIGLEPVHHRWRWILRPEVYLDAHGIQGKPMESCNSRKRRNINCFSHFVSGIHCRALPFLSVVKYAVGRNLIDNGGADFETENHQQDTMIQPIILLITTACLSHAMWMNAGSDGIITVWQQGRMPTFTQRCPITYQSCRTGIFVF